MLEAFALTDPGRVRSTNQDTFRIAPEIGLFLVADGMGGARGGARAAELAANTVLEEMREVSVRDAETMLKAFEEANRTVLAAASADARLEGMGTTVVAVQETGADEVVVASVGDSRAYLLRNGELKKITEDQTWVQEVGKPMGLDDHALREHPMRHVLTMAVGVAEPLRVNRHAIKVAAGDLLLLCSDGLHGVAPESIIRRHLTENDSLEVKCRALIAAAHAGGAPDNITAMVLRVPNRSR